MFIHRDHGAFRTVLDAVQIVQGRQSTYPCCSTISVVITRTYHARLRLCIEQGEDLVTEVTIAVHPRCALFRRLGFGSWPGDANQC